MNLRTSSARAEKNLGPELQFDGNSRPQLLTRAATATAATTAKVVAKERTETTAGT